MVKNFNKNRTEWHFDINIKLDNKEIVKYLKKQNIAYSFKHI